MPFIENHAKTLRRLFAWATPFYSLATRIRNRLFDKGICKSARFDFPIICVGNLCAGGSGKTPMTEFLVRRLRNDYAVGIVSRGYGRRRKGNFMAAPGMTSEAIGDEPVQYMDEFFGACPRGFGLYLAAHRAEGVQGLLHEFPQMQVCLLDDAYQHRQITAGFNILISDFSEPYFHDKLLPAGTLRESTRGADRADIIVFSKCPLSMSRRQKQDFIQELHLKPHQKVFFTHTVYGNFVIAPATGVSLPDTQKIILFTGIANPLPLANNLRTTGYDILANKRFGDHHAYSEKEMAEIAALYHKLKAEHGEVMILTTQKDYCRIKDTKAFSYICSLPIAYVPIRTEFLFKEEDLFMDCIKNYIEHGKI